MNVFSRRVRGFRLLDLIGLALLILVIVGVYLAKTFAGRDRCGRTPDRGPTRPHPPAAGRSRTP